MPHYHPDEARCTCETLVSVFCSIFSLPLFIDILTLTMYASGSETTTRPTNGSEGEGAAPRPRNQLRLRLNPTRQQQKAPVFLQFCRAIVEHGDHRNEKKKGSVHLPAICMTVAVLLNERNREMVGLQTCISLLLYASNAQKQVSATAACGCFYL